MNAKVDMREVRGYIYLNLKKYLDVEGASDYQRLASEILSVFRMNRKRRTEIQELILDLENEVDSTMSY